MADVERFVFTHPELVEAMVKAQGIHDGRWMLYVEFGIKGGNAGSSEQELNPAAIVPILKVGVQRIDETHPLATTNLSVDAAKVNPAALPRPRLPGRRVRRVTE